MRVVMLTVFDVDSSVYAALRAGASGFLLKDIPPAELVRAIRVVADGEGLLTPTVTRRLITEFCRGPDLSHLFDELDVRDRVQLVIVGYETGLVTPGRRP